MKWSSLQPTEGNFTFAAADAQVAFAKAHDMRCEAIRSCGTSRHRRGCSTTPNGVPMTPTPENKALLLQRLENHIRAVVVALRR